MTKKKRTPTNQGKHTPLTRQRSAWIEGPPPFDTPWPSRYYQRNVSDGILRAIVAIEPTIGWHLSISHARETKDGIVPGRYPQWDEIMHAIRSLMPHDLTYAQIIPPDEGGEYVSFHATTFHFHQLPPPSGTDAVDRDGNVVNAEILERRFIADLQSTARTEMGL